MTDEIEQRPVQMTELKAGVKMRAGHKVTLLVGGVAARPLADDGSADGKGAGSGAAGAGSGDGAAGAGSGAGAAGAGAEGGVKGAKFAIEATILAPGGTPLVNEKIRIHDPDTKEQVGEPGITDKDGVFRARVPAQKEYHLHTEAEEAEEHPDAFDDPDHPQAGKNPDPDEHVVLFVELVDAGGQPVTGEKVTVKDSAGQAHDAQTDDSGHINLIVEHGVFTVEAQGKTFTAHSLFTGDLGDDQQPYRFVLS